MTSARSEPSSTTRRPRRTSSIKRWWSENGTGKADEGFVSWAAAQLPAEPTTIQRQTEQATVKQLKASRDPAGNRAAEWLNKHGCEDVWASFTAQQLALRSTTDDEPSDTEMKTVLKLASEVASAAQDRSGSPAASQPKPCSGATKPARADCSCNYPSTQSTMSAAARTYLGELSPYRFDQYAWMEQQVDLAARLRRARAAERRRIRRPARRSRGPVRPRHPRSRQALTAPRRRSCRRPARRRSAR